MTFQFKTKPFKHQLEIFEQTREAAGHALFLEMGLGKSKIMVDTAAWQYMQGMHRGLLVVAPRNVHRNWITDELPAHLNEELAERARGFAYTTGKANTKTHERGIREAFENKGFATLAMTYESLKTDKGWHTFQYWMKHRPSLLVLDESRRIKTPGSKVGKRFIAVGRRAQYKRVLDGTPVPNGPFDIYNQMKFLNEDFWRQHDLDSFATFKSYFGEFKKGEIRGAGGKLIEFDQLTQYRRLDELQKILSGHSSRLMKDDVLDLPPKLYSRRYFDMTPKQCEVYCNIRDEYLHDWGDGRITTAELAIVRLMRLHQITRGYIPVATGEPLTELEGGNPCQELLASICDDVPHQGIIWCRFDKDVELTLAHLQNNAVRYDGKVSEEQLEKNKRRFKAGEVQWFVAKTQVGGSGLTLNEAKTVIYHSNDFNLDARLQSEDRCHRLGQSDRVHYIDLIARLPNEGRTIDDYIRDKLLKKDVISARILGDPIREWI